MSFETHDALEAQAFMELHMGWRLSLPDIQGYTLDGSGLDDITDGGSTGNDPDYRLLVRSEMNLAPNVDLSLGLRAVVEGERFDHAFVACHADQAQARMDDFTGKWQGKYPASVNLWRNAWNEFIPFLDYDVEIRKVICSTNAIESLNARYRRAVRARGHFPNEASAMKTLYLVTRSLDPKGTGQTRWAMRWKPALNAFAITFADRMPTAQDR
mgnify:CR=1 FL=1